MSKLARTRLPALFPAALSAVAIVAACATSEDERATPGSGGARAAGGSLGRGGRAGSGATAGAGGSAGAFGSGGSLGSVGSLDRSADESNDARPESGSEAADVGSEARLDAITETDAAQENDGVSTADSSGDSGAGSDRCPGQDLVLSGTPRAASVSGDSTSFTADYSATCGGGPGRDVVYHLVTPQSGLLTFTLTPNGFDAVLYVRVGPCATGTPVCRNLAGAGGAETLQLSAGAGVELYVFVDSDAGEGPFTLSVSY